MDGDVDEHAAHQQLRTTILTLSHVPKELDAARYSEDVEKVLAAGKTIAGTHRPIMVEEVLACLGP